MPKVFSYLNISGYTENLTELVSIIITLLYCVAYLLIIAIPCLKRLRAVLTAYKIIGDLITSFFYIFLVTELCKSIHKAVNSEPISWI